MTAGVAKLGTSVGGGVRFSAGMVVVMTAGGICEAMGVALVGELVSDWQASKTIHKQSKLAKRQDTKNAKRLILLGVLWV
jgi:hypothetical protein